MHLKSPKDMREIKKVIKRITKNDGIAPVTCCDVNSSMEQLYVYVSTFLQWVRQKNFVAKEHA